MRLKSVVLQSRKKPQVLQKNFIKKKKKSSSLFVQIGTLKHCANFFLNKGVSSYLSLSDFKVPKNCPSQ